MRKPSGALIAIWLPALFFIAWTMIPVKCSAGQLRINLKDGNSLEVSYCWEEAGEIKFEVPGGVVGIPKPQVASIEEIITQKTLDPQVMARQGEVYVNADVQEAEQFKQLISQKIPIDPAYKVLDQDQVKQILQERFQPQTTKSIQPKRIYTSILERRGEISEWVRLPNNSTLLLISNAVSSRDNFSHENIYLTLFDGDGNPLKRIQCEVHKLEVNRKQLRQLGIIGELYALTAVIPPDPRIKRYEITTTRF